MEEKKKVTTLVPDPMPYPDYSVAGTPTPRQLREMAVRAMGDMLSLRWTPDKYMFHMRRNPNAPRKFEYFPGMVFSGTPYCNGGAALVCWFEYYDPATGLFSFPGDGEAMNEKLSSTCARSVIYGWSTVVNSIHEDARATYHMSQFYGYLPVGGYTYDKELTDFRPYGTDTVIAENGWETMLKALSQVQIADALLKAPKNNPSVNHVMMAREDAVTVYLPDGSIDPDASCIIIQDQRGGKGKGFYESEYAGITVHSFGRIGHPISFRKLLEEHYIPLTCTEFLGEKPYEAPGVRCSAGESTDLQTLLEAELSANYPICVVRLVAEDARGVRTVLDRRTQALERSFSMQEFSDVLTSPQLTAKFCRLDVEAVVPNGQKFTPVSVKW